MKILYLARSWPPEQTAVAAQTVARLEQRLQCAGRVVAGFSDDATHLPAGAMRVRMDGGAWSRWQYRRAIHRMVRAEAPTLVVAAGWDHPAVSVPAVVVTDVLPSRMRPGRLRPSRVICATQHMAEALASSGYAGRVAAIPAPLPPVEPARGPDVEGRLRIVVPGPIGPGSGAHIVVDAVARLPAEDKARVWLHVVGPDADIVYATHLRNAAVGQPISVSDTGMDAAVRWSDWVIDPRLDEGHAQVGAHLALRAGRPLLHSGGPALLGVDAESIAADDVPAVRRRIQRAIASFVAGDWRREDLTSSKTAMAQLDDGALMARYRDVFEAAMGARKGWFAR